MITIIIIFLNAGEFKILITNSNYKYWINNNNYYYYCPFHN